MATGEVVSETVVGKKGCGVSGEEGSLTGAAFDLVGKGLDDFLAGGGEGE